MGCESTRLEVGWRRQPCAWEPASPARPFSAPCDATSQRAMFVRAGATSASDRSDDASCLVRQPEHPASEGHLLDMQRSSVHRFGLGPSRHRPARIVSALAISLGSLALAACSGSDGATAPSPAADRVSTTTASDPGAPPLTGSDAPLLSLLATSGGFESALAQLQAESINRCMASLGFDYVQATPEAVGSTQDVATLLLQRRYSAPQQRAADGAYGYVFDSGDPSMAEPEEPPVSAAELEALTGEVVQNVQLRGSDGSPIGEIQIRDGCVGQALVEVFGSVEEYLAFRQKQSLVGSISAESLSRLYSSPDAIAASAEWSACMRNAGFDYSTPLAVANQDWAGPRPGLLEQQTAAADFSCRTSTGVADKLASVEAAVQRSLLEPYPNVANDLAETVAAMTASAAAGGDR